MLIDVYSLVKCTIAQLISECSGISIAKDELRTSFPLAMVSSVAPIKYKLDAQRLADRIESVMHSALLYDESGVSDCEMLERVFQLNGHINFILTTDALTSFMRNVICTVPKDPPKQVDFSKIGIAIWRMAMLSRGRSLPCPDDFAVKRALWVTLGITQPRIDDKIMLQRKDAAAQALLSMAHHMEPRNRQNLLESCSSVADCAYRLLSTPI